MEPVYVDLAQVWLNKVNPIFSSYWLLILGRFPFVRTDRPDPSWSNENFTINQNYPATSVKS